MENDPISGAAGGTNIASQSGADTGQEPRQGEQQVMASIFSNLLTRMMNTANENANNG